jgi:hypothetical protein
MFCVDKGRDSVSYSWAHMWKPCDLIAWYYELLYLLVTELKFIFPFPVFRVIITNKIGNVRVMQNEGAFDLCILI